MLNFISVFSCCFSFCRSIYSSQCFIIVHREYRGLIYSVTTFVTVCTVSSNLHGPQNLFI